jgi:hypothetical protein
MTRTRLYRDGVVVLEDFPMADIAVYLAEGGSVGWIDLCAPTPEDFATIGVQVGLHQLAVEDALHAQVEQPSPCDSSWKTPFAAVLSARSKRPPALAHRDHGTTEPYPGSSSLRHHSIPLAARAPFGDYWPCGPGGQAALGAQ